MSDVVDRTVRQRPATRMLSRGLVVSTARAHIERDGVDRLSLRGVARELNVTAPALYQYVADKSDLIAGVASEHFEALARRFEAVDEAEPLERIRALARAYVEHARSAPALFPLLFRYPPRPLPDVAAFEPAARAFDIAARATAEAVDIGLLAVTDPHEASTTMWCAVHGVAEVLLMGFAVDDDTADALVERVIDTVLAGLVHPLVPRS